MEAVIFIGIQASGKSSFYRERFFNTHVRINLDMLKTAHRQQVLLDACLASKQPFVIDNTNATIAKRSKFISAAKAAGFRVVGYYLRSNLDSALSENDKRGPTARIPRVGLLGTYRELQLPDRKEGFDEREKIWLDFKD